ncbi:hypothetical protein BDN70DRAFT_888066 [Pholiota conissans]|uniref:Uncharacterized protein n=1 Tax=Pholiota conissans TaxID=109636 RepID=A0A9P6CLS0_9AGAR|nr:hypothetical protein BDN70DRAFT_888066 [Pholiota conissans]
MLRLLPPLRVHLALLRAIVRHYIYYTFKSGGHTCDAFLHVVSFLSFAWLSAACSVYDVILSRC